MNTEPKYTNVDDHDKLDKMADMVILNCKHEFNEAELKQEADMLAQCVSDKQQEENNKKVAMSVFKNKIDTLQGEINLHASNINHGFTYIDKAATMYRDFDKQRRVYFDKQSGDYLKDEAFHPSDFQKKLDFEEQEKAIQQQIEENNQTGEFAERTLKDDLFAPLDEIIVDKKVSGHKLGAEGEKLSKAVKDGIQKEKPTPKDNLPLNYGKYFDPETDLPNEDDLEQSKD